MYIATNPHHQPETFDIPAARENLLRRFQEHRKRLGLLTEQARKDAQRLSIISPAASTNGVPCWSPTAFVSGRTWISPWKGWAALWTDCAPLTRPRT
jgi:hypothetical protein